MNYALANLVKIQQEIILKTSKSNNNIKLPKVIAVSKTFSMDSILPVINHGHIDFGENKIQEAVVKWQDVKEKYNHLKLHMIGRLQKNKVKYAVRLFDYIHSLDNLRLAEKIANEEVKQNKKIKIFIQVNISEENQKNGIVAKELNNFYNVCINDFKLNIIGLMCIPANNIKNSYHYKEMYDVAKKLKIKELSMGMSGDYLDALNYGATYLRIGSKIFGERS
ncbi:YggS family pyridoxal phosphate-dependent enzyme [Candidatus Pelagibacter sp.]|nr:YggS family pyridoxal phosphate-dependent enzyme [Candidatus Pelagibacter sp.]